MTSRVADQVGCYLPSATAERLDDYARALELSRARLCALLVVRAVRSGRPLTRAGDIDDPSEPVRVTARLRDPSLKAAFANAATSAGLGVDDAAAGVFLSELGERWLEEAVRS